MEMESVGWLLLLVVLIVIELATMGLTTIWFAGGAVVGFVASILGANIWVQAVLFFAVSIPLLIFTRPFAARYINRDHVKTNVDSLIGRKAVVTQEIDNLMEHGEVRLEGKDWMARAADGGKKIAAGTVVEVVRITGVKLIVKEEEGQ